MVSDWSELQMDLLKLIINRFDAVVDIVRFKAVCSRWNIAAQLCIASPLLILPSDNKRECDARSLFSLAENKFYKINRLFDGFHRFWCVGSSHGWLVILDTKANPHLLNPFSGAKVQLPLITTLITSQELQRFTWSPCFVETIGYVCISKAILMSLDLYLSDLCKSKSFCVVVIYGPSPRRLAFCMPGDNTWTRFGGEDRIYVDLICHNCMLYALSYKGLVEVWDFHNLFPRKVVDIYFSTTVCQSLWAHSFFLDKKAFLVESKGELLFVLVLIGERDEKVGEEYLDYRTIQEFAVYKLDYSGKRWVPVETLSDQALFISKNESMSVSTQDFPKLRDNSIYFIISLTCNFTGQYNIGIYNFKDKKIVDKADDNKHCGLIASRAFWISPNPWKYIWCAANDADQEKAQQSCGLSALKIILEKLKAACFQRWPHETGLNFKWSSWS